MKKKVKSILQYAEYMYHKAKQLLNIFINILFYYYRLFLYGENLIYLRDNSAIFKYKQIYTHKWM